MPGCNRAVFGCGTCRRTKGIGIFKLPRSVRQSTKAVGNGDRNGLMK